MTVTLKEKNLLSKVKPTRIFIPIAIGLVVVSYLFYKEFDPKAFYQITFDIETLFWLFLSLLLMILRDVGYIVRLKMLSSNDLNWKQAIRVIFLWEFTSAVTPSAIGGTSVAVIYVHKEHISIGRSTAIVLATSFLDELYFLIIFPLLFLFVSTQGLFGVDLNDSSSLFMNEFFYFAVIGYSLKFIFTAFVSYGIFINPNSIKKILKLVYQLPYLNRWASDGQKIGEDIVLASNELNNKSMLFWIKAFVATCISWTARYWVVNCMFLAFFIVHDHFLIFARQFVMWIMMLVSPTPGGSGFAEYVFNEYLGQYIPIVGLAIPLAFLWRVVSYYLYLIIGAFIFPRWIKDKFSN